jgi:hypothetical protein
MERPVVEDILIDFLWVSAAAALVWVCLPMIMALLGLTRFTSRYRDDPTEAEPHGQGTEYEAIFAQLTSLGLHPCGFRVDEAHWYAFHWVKTFHVYVFATAAGDCFASVYRLIEEDDWRVTLATGLEDATLFETGSTMPELQLREDDFVRWGHVTDDLAELLALHREAVARYSAETGRAVIRLDLATLDRLICNCSSRVLRRCARLHALACLVLPLVCFGVPVLTLVQLVGFDHWLVPLATLAIGLGCSWLFLELVRRALHASREEDDAQRTGVGGNTGQPTV